MTAMHVQVPKEQQHLSALCHLIWDLRWQLSMGVCTAATLQALGHPRYAFSAKHSRSASNAK